KRRELVELKNRGDQLAYTAEKTLKDMGDKVSAEDRGSIESAISSLREALKGDDADAIKRTTEALEQASHKIAEQMASWQDRAFGNLRRGRDWRQPQQRRYYRVRTEEGEVYELYADWSPGRRRRKGEAQGTRWYLHRRLSSGAAKKKPVKEEPSEPPSA
ncbi:hypothetical protein LCGC14_2264740, partial [marine sediment metagenome]